MKSMWPPLVAIFFMTNFYRDPLLPSPFVHFIACDRLNTFRGPKQNFFTRRKFNKHYVNFGKYILISFILKKNLNRPVCLFDADERYGWNECGRKKPDVRQFVHRPAGRNLFLLQVDLSSS